MELLALDMPLQHQTIVFPIVSEIVGQAHDGSPAWGLKPFDLAYPTPRWMISEPCLFEATLFANLRVHFRVGIVLQGMFGPLFRGNTWPI